MKRDDSALVLVAEQIQEAADARKCWACDCLHQALDSIDRAIPTSEQPTHLQGAIATARERLVPVRYNCLGCKGCYPAVALNALGDEVEAAACPRSGIEERAGWPALPGSYTVLKYQAPVAVCALTDEALMAGLTATRMLELSVVGTMQTENLGVERLIINTLANPSIRFVIVCGADSRQAIGHLPGQSLVALSRSGIGEGSRIIGARGKRPFLFNVSAAAVEHFRRTVEVVDLVGVTDVNVITQTVQECAGRQVGTAAPFYPERVIMPVAGYLPDRMVPDPSGYFVIYADTRQRLLSTEHYRTDGLLTTVLEGRTAAEVYTPIIERGLISRLDHAAYIGRELARAERALLATEPYVQDGAPETIPAVDPRAPKK
jgi:tetrahydromethanopterin S-methyltransferase subunit A